MGIFLRKEWISLNSIINTAENPLEFANFGKYQDSLIPTAVDAGGKLLFMNSVMPVESDALDIRPLTEVTDLLSIAETDLEIRSLSGSTDSILLYAQSHASGSDGGIITPLSTRTFLPTDVSVFKSNCFYVSNLSGISVAVNVTLEIAPVNIGSYYLDDSVEFSLLGGSALLLEPSILMKYARVRISALLALAEVSVFYFGRT